MAIKEDVMIQALVATPPVSIATMQVLGMTVSDWVLVGTAVLIVLQIGYLLHKWVRMATAKEDACSSDKG